MTGKPLHKEIRKAIANGEDAGLRFEPNKGRSSHTYGYLYCTCGERIAIYSSGKAAEHGAKLLNSWVARHRNHT